MFFKLKYFSLLFLISVIASCQSSNKKEKNVANESDSLIIGANHQELLDTNKYNFPWLAEYHYSTSIVNIIDPPKEYERKNYPVNSFQNWLRHLPLKNDNTVFLFNGEEKHNQSAQYRVIDIDVGTKDLQQCADAVMRLRAEYLFASNQKNSIHFNYTNGVAIPFSKWSSGYFPSLKSNKVIWVSSSNNSSYSSFKKYINNIFMYAGTASLEKELNKTDLKDVEIGDVFIKGGFPGHAVIVVDVAINKTNGDKCFMLAQSYMPAQNIHILKNPNNSDFSPWYSIKECKDIIETPEWTFYPDQLKRF